MHPCVLLVVAIVHPAYLSKIPVVLFLVFTQPPQSLSLVAVSSFSRASLAVGSNFQMLARLFTSIASLVFSRAPMNVCGGTHSSCKLFHCLLHIGSLSCHTEKSARHPSIQSCQHFWELLLCRQVFYCHLETGRAHRIALLHVHVFETLIDVSFRCYESVPLTLFVPLFVPGFEFCQQLHSGSQPSSRETFVSTFAPCHARADHPLREARRPRARAG